MTILLLISLSLLVIPTLVSIVNVLTAPRLGRPRRNSPTDQPIVTIIIPARNEERSIRTCLSGLMAQDYKHSEIIVIDDNSTDNTAAIVREFPTARLITGAPLPEGWTGKNWACHQGAQAATGEILIFTDADTRHTQTAVSNSVAWMKSHKLAMLSAFPQQITVTFAEKMVVPAIELFLYAGIPLWLTYLSKNKHLAAANGQWVCFTKSAYTTLGGHESVAMEIVEDVELSRRAKALGLRLLTLAATGVIYCRMYESASEVREGFAKNLFGIVRYRTLPFAVLLLGFFVGCVVPSILIFVPSVWELAAIAVGLNMFFRLIIALRFKHPVWESVLLQPLAILWIIFIGIESYFRIKGGGVRWKGRIITVQQ